MGVVEVSLRRANPVSFVVRGVGSAKVTLMPTTQKLRVVQSASPLPFAGGSPVTAGGGISLTGNEINMSISSLPTAP